MADDLDPRRLLCAASTIMSEQHQTITELRAEIVRLREHINGLAASHPLARPYEPPTWLTKYDTWRIEHD